MRNLLIVALCATLVCPIVVHAATLRAQLDSLQSLVSRQQADSLADVANARHAADDTLRALLRPVTFLFVRDTPHSVLLRVTATDTTNAAAVAFRRMSFDVLVSQYRATRISDDLIRLPWDMVGMLPNRFRQILTPMPVAQPPPPPK